jgi:suppressor for copper-sensitivity B
MSLNNPSVCSENTLGANALAGSTFRKRLENERCRIPALMTISKIRSALLALVCLIGFANGRLSLADNFEITTTANWLSKNQVELSIHATIEPGLHIYGIDQAKPILATKIQIDASDSIVSFGDFETLTPPTRQMNEILGVEVLEHFGSAQWRTRIVVREGTESLTISGLVFAQACEDEKCFPPESHRFSVALAPRDSLPMAQSTESQLQKANAPTQGSIANNEQASVLERLSVVPAGKPTRSLLAILPIAFLAGLMLNFMPCVLPVVAIKLLSLVKQSSLDRRRVLLTNLSYSSGLVFVMLVLATLASFAGLGWGEQFSRPAFTIALSGIVFAFGLSLLGVWEIPSLGFRLGAKRNGQQSGYASAFGNGVLSTLLATPCSGPFLGVALAWAVAQGPYITYIVFATIGLGMASPFLIVGIFPSLIRFLPKPGAWMNVFKQVTGFVMLATVVYLISFVPIASVVPTLLLLLGIGLALWLTSLVPAYESIGKRLATWSFASVLILSFAWVSFGWLEGVTAKRFERDAVRFVSQSFDTPSSSEFKMRSSQSDSGIAWEDFSLERLEALLQAGKPVFVDFTADWCLTCKANETVAIETTKVAEVLKAGDIVALKADKTAPNPAVDSLLRKLGNTSASIPFYAVFPKGRPLEPILLDGLYSSPDPFVNALQQKL